jgi:hypothetical protein
VPPLQSGLFSRSIAVVALGLSLVLGACVTSKQDEVQRATEGPTAEEIYMARFVGDYGRVPTFDETSAFRVDLDERVTAYLARHPALSTSTRASHFTFHRRAAVGMSREEVTLLLGAPAAQTDDRKEMEMAARQFWPGVGAHAREMWIYPGGWFLYFDGDRLADLTVTGKPPL